MAPQHLAAPALLPGALEVGGNGKRKRAGGKGGRRGGGGPDDPDGKGVSLPSWKLTTVSWASRLSSHP